MLRVTTIRASTASVTARYYTGYLTKEEEELPGLWAGEQARQLGLIGDVTTFELEELLSGRDPVSGRALGREFVDRVTKDGRVVSPVAGFDATFSAPKSLSVWWALTGDDGLAQCHDVAVTAAVAAIERYGATTRIRSNGSRLHPDTGGLTVASFRQTTSRLDDPQVHTHVVISSKVQTEDGRCWALDARVLKKHQRTFGGIYQSVLRQELTTRYGVAFGGIVNGQAEIAGIPLQLLEQFSKRTAQVDAVVTAKLAEFYTREGRDPTPIERGAIGREAALDTRGPKSGNSAAELRDRWLAEALSVGVTPESLTADIEIAALFAPVVEPMTVDDVVEVLSQRSSWHRLDVMRALCDGVRPQPGVTGVDWVGMLERNTDRILDTCMDIDPTGVDRQRRSDGRSVWIAPIETHFTSHLVLTQEEHILSWAIDNQLGEPRPSSTITRGRLDLMQLDAAAAVAGSDRLVIVVGPAGAGKTAMLKAAVDDFHQIHHRPVIGLAPTAKAARKLRDETGLMTDTVAKLLWEHNQPHLASNWDLGPGVTVIVDEAGMLATGDLHRLIELADQHDWRLALIGDSHQLQAVNRGGMFAELCATGRTIELDTIHRFTNPWEAHASLQLRHGNTTVLYEYEHHGRIRAGWFNEHLDTIATTWLQRPACSMAITTTTNEHVQAINTTIQRARIDRGDLDPRHSVDIADGSVHVDDVIVTRRNDRQLRTRTGDIVRNRDYWNVTSLHPNGAIDVTRIDGHGDLHLPAGYVAEHVQLGYAATEPGNQSDTTTTSITLATPATTGRGLYVGATRGRDENLILVVTDTHQPRDARDVLERILTMDRADIPATTQRRQLAATVPRVNTPTPRCQIPDWFDTVHRDARTTLVDAEQARHQEQQRDLRLDQIIARNRGELDRLEPLCAPHGALIETAQRAVSELQDEQRRAARNLESTGRLGRHRARTDLDDTRTQIAAAEQLLKRRQHDAAPLLDARDEAHVQIARARDGQSTNRIRSRWDDQQGNLERVHETVAALDIWKNWANGHPVPADHAARAATVLGESDRPGHRELANPLTDWVRRHHPELVREPVIERRGMDLGIDL